MEEEIIDTIPDLPPDIIRTILAKLPIFKLPTWRLVSRAWNNLVLDHASSTSKVVSNTFLVRTMYRNNSSSSFDTYSTKIKYIDFDVKHSKGMNKVATYVFDLDWVDIRIANCCNGLLFCLIKGAICRRTQAGVLNPMTNEYIELPRSTKEMVFSYGLGFSPETKQYKVVRVSFRRGVEIFVLGRSRNWSQIDSKSFSIRMQDDGIYFNGGMYWIAVREISEEDGNRRYVTVICRLDVGDETLKQVSLPRVSCDWNLTIGVFNGSFYVMFNRHEYSELELWTMRSDDEGRKASWKKEFVFCGIQKVPSWWRPRGVALLQPIKTYEDGEILCLFDGHLLLLYNPKTGTKKILNGRKKKLNPSDRTKTLWVYQIDSFSFDPLQKIFTGDA